jgi:hypothetical protein
LFFATDFFVEVVSGVLVTAVVVSVTVVED